MSLSKAARVLAAAAWLAPAAAAAEGRAQAARARARPQAPEGYFDEAFALEPGGARLYLVRTDGATFAKLEVVDLATGKTTSSFDLPKDQTAVERLEPLRRRQGRRRHLARGHGRGARARRRR